MATRKGTEKIKTLICLDLESTGLGSPGARPKITEISLLAVHREILQGSARKRPLRVVDKLTLCVYPMKQIEPSAADVTGLHNDTLYYQKDFDSNIAQLLNHFLLRHEQPICLVAHNGLKFDFPLLKSQLQEIDASLPDNILVADSLEMLREFDEEKFKIGSESVTSFANQHTPERIGQAVKRKLEFRPNVHEVSAIEKVMNWNLDTKISKLDKKEEPCCENSNGIKPLNSNISSSGDITQTSALIVSEKESNEEKVRISSDSVTSSANPHKPERIGQAVKRKLEFNPECCIENPVSDTEENVGSIPDELLLQAHVAYENEALENSAHEQTVPEVPRTNTVEAPLNNESKEENDHQITHIETKDTEHTTQIQENQTRTLSAELKSDNIHDETNKIQSLIPQNQTPSNIASKQAAIKSLPTPSPVTSSSRVSGKRVSYKLGDVYERVVGTPMRNAHRAEDDCSALLRICQMQAEQVCDWLDRRARLFSSVQPMYPPSPRKIPPLSPGHFPYHDAM